MKSLVEGECGRSNTLVGLANNYGTSNQRIAPQASRGASSLLPSNSLGEQFANDFLQQKAQSAIAPASFNMQSLSAQLPKQASSSSLASTWSNEFGARPANQLATQWANQFQPSARPAYEGAWSQATSQSAAPGQQSLSIDSGMWSAEFLDNVDTSLQKSQNFSSEMADSWANEFAEQQPDVWRHAESEWDAIQRNIELAQGDQISRAFSDNYVHQTDNPFLQASDPLTDGDRLMNSGDLGSAMLAYEAAVQRDPQDAKLVRKSLHSMLEEAVEKAPQDADAWCRLGLSHAENEHDVKAITAFNQCLKLEPNNKETLLALSVSMANESMDNDALQQLDKWISAYEGGVATSDVNTGNGYKNSFIDPAVFQKVESRFLAAARMQQGTPDAALQNALGVLYNLNRNFDRAVDCVRLAIASQPQDPRLWNRLGATLANGDRTAEAVAAYREALNRYPTYVRARYNLGISCMHLNSYRESVEHFVSALDLQKGGSEGHSIWPTLRSATIRMKGAGPDLLRALDARDLAAYKNALRAIPPNAQ